MSIKIALITLNNSVIKLVLRKICLYSGDGLKLVGVVESTLRMNDFKISLKRRKLQYIV